MLPNTQNCPTLLPQQQCCGRIAGTSALQLWKPVGLIASRTSPMQWTKMPKTAVNEYRQAKGPKYKVWIADD
jgi:hypothetical protein